MDVFILKGKNKKVYLPSVRHEHVNHQYEYDNPQGDTDSEGKDNKRMVGRVCELQIAEVWDKHSTMGEHSILTKHIKLCVHTERISGTFWCGQWHLCLSTRQHFYISVSVSTESSWSCLNGLCDWHQNNRQSLASGEFHKKSTGDAEI